jgi:uncharacterized protein (TIGR03435 family)
MAKYFAYLVSAIALAQSPTERPRFEVASIKLHPGIGNLVHIQPLPGGRLVVENFSLKFLIQTAYGADASQILGGPDWIGSDRYDIEAKAEGNASGKLMTGPMLQTLLEDRFKLSIHRETRQLPIYELTLAKSGVKMPPAKAGACIPFSMDSPPWPTPAPGEPRPIFCGFRGFGVEGLNRKLEMPGVTMTELASALSRSELRRKIVDKTGLAGEFDVHLIWSLDTPSSADPSAAAGPSIFTAVQEQLGLKLESAKGPVEVLVIDHIERPSAN